MNRRQFIAGSAGLAVFLSHLTAARGASASRRPASRRVMLMNRIAPSSSILHIADADGSNARPLLDDPVFEYRASIASAGDWVVFTSERAGDGQSDLYRARLDGSGLEPLAATPAVEDSGVMSPDGTRIAYVSTRDTGTANVWVRDLRSGTTTTNLTALPHITGEAGLPNGFFRPAWSPDGEWLAFSSDRNTPWRGHDGGRGWEHTQALSIYVARADGSGFRQVATRPDHCLGSPKWSPDGRRIVFYELTTEATWGAHRPEAIGTVASQIVSVDVETGARVVHTSGPGLKLYPQIFADGDIGYMVKGGDDAGLHYCSGRAPVRRALKAPAWTADGRRVVYEVTGNDPRPQGKRLYSFRDGWDYRFTDVFPTLARDGTFALTEKQNGNSSIVVMNPDGSDRRTVYDPADHGLPANILAKGLAGAFQPAWSPDSRWIAFGVGYWFQERATHTARVMRIRRDGTGLEPLTDGSVNAGFPSYSADGRQIVFRVWSEKEKGLRILDLDSGGIRVLTTAHDNLPGWSPDGRRIVFTRKIDAVNFEIFTIRPDGSGLRRLTNHGGNDGHAVWTADGRIAWSSGMHGFRDEAALYDDTFQPYGQIFVMNADGSAKQALTDSLWEDSMPLFLPYS